MEAKFLINGDMAISIQIANEISIENSRMINALKNLLEENPIEGVFELLPTYCSVMIYYHPEIIRYDELVEVCKKVLAGIAETDLCEHSSEMMIEIPVLYGDEWGIDLPELAEYHNMTEQEIIDIHTGYPFYTYMLGFTPGHGYLGSDNPLRMPRRATPRPKVERGCIVVMNNQSVIEPIDSPNGWNIIGKSPLHVFDINKEDPFMIKAGMWVKFKAISRTEYDRIEKLVEAGEYQVKIYGKENANGDHH